MCKHAAFMQVMHHYKYLAVHRLIKVTKKLIAPISEDAEVRLRLLLMTCFGRFASTSGSRILYGDDG
jgi:hypothetical protein